MRAWLTARQSSDKLLPHDHQWKKCFVSMSPFIARIILNTVIAISYLHNSEERNEAVQIHRSLT